MSVVDIEFARQVGGEQRWQLEYRPIRSGRVVLLRRFVTQQVRGRTEVRKSRQHGREYGIGRLGHLHQAGKRRQGGLYGGEERGRLGRDVTGKLVVLEWRRVSPSWRRVSAATAWTWIRWGGRPTGSSHTDSSTVRPGRWTSTWTTYQEPAVSVELPLRPAEGTGSCPPCPTHHHRPRRSSSPSSTRATSCIACRPFSCPCCRSTCWHRADFGCAPSAGAPACIAGHKHRSGTVAPLNKHTQMKIVWSNLIL